MLITKCLDCGKIKRIAKRMCDHDRLRLVGKCCLKLCHINVVLRNRHIHKYRHGTVLDHCCDRCRKSRCHRDHLIPAVDLAVTQKR